MKQRTKTTMVRVLTLTAALAFSTAAYSQGLTPADVDAAISAGLAGKSLSSQCYATSGLMDFGEFNGGFTVVIEGPVGRIMRLALAAKKKYQPFTAADVTDEMLSRTLWLVAEPNKPTFSSGVWHRAANAEHIVLKRKGAKGDNPTDVLQAESMEPYPVSWSNAMGGKWEGQGITAKFSIEAFQKMPGDEVDIVVVTPAGERRCKIGKKDRAALR